MPILKLSVFFNKKFRNTSNKKKNERKQANASGHSSYRALKEIFSRSNLILKQENRVNFNGKINKAKAYII